MIVALVATLMASLAGGVGGDHISRLQMLAEASKLTAHYVEDPTRAADAVQILADMQTNLQDSLNEISSHQSDFIALDESYSCTAADFAAPFAAVDKVWMRAEQELIQGFFQLRQHVTREEWNAIFADLQKKLK